MNTIFRILVLISLNFSLFAQDSPYYYTFKEKKYLDESTDHVVVNISEQLSESEKILAVVENIEKKGFETSGLYGQYNLLVKISKDLESTTNILSGIEKIANIQKVYKTKENGVEIFWNNKINIQFMPGVSETTILELLTNNNLEIVSKSLAAPAYIVKLTNKEDILEVANSIAVSEDIYYCYPDFYSPSLVKNSTPNDYYYSKQFYLNNTGQGTAHGSSTPGADIHMEEAWDITMGSADINITILDDGIRLDHEDLSSDKILPGWNYAYGHSNVSPGDLRAHGMGCAGIIAADHNNVGIAGIAPNCKIRMLNIFDYSGTGTSSGNVALAIDDAWTNGADVISNSWSFHGEEDPYFCPAIRSAIFRALNNGRDGKGCVVVFSASNSANRVGGHPGVVSFPSSIDEVILVAASDRNDMVANYSPNCMLASNIYLDLSAPSHRASSSVIATEGPEVWSLDQMYWWGVNNFTTNPDEGDPEGHYNGQFGGTSAAAPQVAAIT